MVSSKVSPLPFNVPIADPETGNPSPFFARQLRQLLDEAIATAVATAAAQAAADAAQATADAAVPQTRLINTTSPIAGGGPLSSDLTLTHAASGVTAASYTNANITVDAKGHVTAASNGSSGSTGTVTSVSVTTANGVSGSVANPTTTPAITITLGAITPSSVNASGTVLGSNLSGTHSGNSSGTNTGDQTFSITGDGTASGSTGVLTLTVTKINGVSLAGLATGILKNTTTTGGPSIAVAADFPTLNQSTTGSAATLTTARNFSIAGGGITAAAVSFDGSGAVALNASVDAGHITLARMASLAATSIIGNNTGSPATPIALTAAQVKTLLAIVAADISDLATAANVQHPGYIAGNWYWTLKEASLGAGATFAANNIKLLPFTISKPITVTQLAAHVTTNTAGNFQLAIYANNATTGRPTGSALCSTGSISTASTGAIGTTLAGGGTTLLSPGTYWMAINQDNAIAVYKTLPQAAPHMSYYIGSATLANVSSGAGVSSLVLGVSQAFGTWPSLTSASFAEAQTAASAVLLLKAA